MNEIYFAALAQNPKDIGLQVTVVNSELDMIFRAGEQ